nr:hypothetical protein Hi04_10k_c3807_00025 [uncultured bacterium]
MKHDEPSVTAEGVAGLRYAATLERDPALRGPDAFGRRFLRWSFALLAGPLRKLTLPYYGRVLPGQYEFIHARTLFYDQVLRDAVEAGARQVAIIGAGYDTRAWRFADLLAKNGVRVIELDHPATQGRKLKRLGASLPPHVSFFAVDLMHMPLERALELAGFDPKVKSFVLWEGCAMYLNEAAVTATLSTIAKMAKGTTLACDLVAASALDGTKEWYGAPELRAFFARRTEPITWGIEPEDVAAYLKKVGLTQQRLFMAADAERTYLMPSGGGPARRMSGFNYMVTATV